ncbi:MAG TPA: hypothetical protein VG711_04670 [Phycisphaerales bacterium]|nr:hypothetical protein [Phycisphaerales bacterium]
MKREELSAEFEPAKDDLKTISLKPKKTNISVRAVVLAWAPYVTDGQGVVRAAWREMNGPGGS